jgi:hypothetical protein
MRAEKRVRIRSKQVKTGHSIHTSKRADTLAPEQRTPETLFRLGSVHSAAVQSAALEPKQRSGSRERLHKRLKMPNEANSSFVFNTWLRKRTNWGPGWNGFYAPEFRHPNPSSPASKLTVFAAIVKVGFGRAQQPAPRGLPWVLREFRTGPRGNQVKKSGTVNRAQKSGQKSRREGSGPGRCLLRSGNSRRRSASTGPLDASAAGALGFHGASSRRERLQREKPPAP